MIRGWRKSWRTGVVRVVEGSERPSEFVNEVKVRASTAEDQIACKFSLLELPHFSHLPLFP